MSTQPSPLGATDHSEVPATRVLASDLAQAQATASDARASTGKVDARAIAEWVLIVASYAILFFGNHWVGSDGGLRFDALSQLIETGHISPIMVSLIGPLFSVPLWYFGKRFLGDARLGCAYYNWLLLGIGLVFFARLLKGRLAPSTIRRFLLVLVAGSMFTYHVQAYYGEVFTAVFVGVGLLTISLKRDSWLGWAAVVVGAANTPASAAAAAAVCAYFVVETRRIRFVAPVFALAALLLAEAVVRRGGLKTGYEGTHGNPTFMPYSGLQGFSYPLFLGVLSLIFSFGKGILFYAPGAFLPVRDLLDGKAEILKAYRVWLIFLAGLLVVYAKWWGWYGGEFWGPRYLFFSSVPASFALALNLGWQRSVRRSLVTLAMLTLSVWIGADGLLFGQAEMGQCSANGYVLEHLCWHVPEFAAWIRPFIVRRALEAKDWVFIFVYATVYVYLAAPVVGFLARSLAVRVIPHVRRVVDWRAWGF